jgi:tetratricopeptide (TPR) repeat protein
LQEERAEKGTDMSGKVLLICVLALAAVLALEAASAWPAEKASAKAPAGGKAAGLVSNGVAKYQAGDRDGALVDFSRAIQAQKDYGPAYYAKASLLFVMGKYTDASDVLQKWVADNQNDTYGWMLAYVANARGGNADRGTLSGMQGLTDEGSWLGQTLALYMDQITPEKYIKAVKQISAPGKRVEEAEMVSTNFFVGEALLIKGDKEGAAKYLKASADSEGPFQWAREMCKADLGRMEKPGVEKQTQPAATKPAETTKR